MSVYNAGDFLRPAVDSILAQTYNDFEFIIVDDGSTDGSSGALADYARCDDRVRLLQFDQVGLTVALNCAAKVAGAALIARMDADDISKPDRFEKQVRYLDENVDCVAVGTSIELIDPDGDVLGTQDSPQTHEGIVELLHRGCGALPHPSTMFRRDIFRQVGCYNEELRYAQDLDLWLRMSEVGQLANLSDTLLSYRLHASSVTALRRDEQLRCAEHAVRNARRRAGRQPHFSMPRTSVPPVDSVLRSWSRMALRNGNPKVARKHAALALGVSPWSPRNVVAFVRSHLAR